MMRELLPGHRRRLGVALVAGVLATGFGVALMATSAWLVSRAAQHPPVLFLLVAVVAVRTFGIGRGVLRYAERLVSHDAALRLLAGLRERLMARLAVVAPAGLPLWRRSDLLTRLVRDVDEVGEVPLRAVLPLAGAAVVGTGAVTLLWILLPAAGICLAVALLLSAVLVPLLDARRAGRADQEAVLARADRDAAVGALLDELTDLQLRGATSGAIDDLAALERRVTAAGARTARSAGVSAAAAVLGTAGAAVATLLAGAAALRSGQLSPVLAATLVLTPLALAEVVQSVGTAGTALRRARVAAGRIREVLAAPDPVPDPAHPRPVPEGPPVLRLHGVSARWPGADVDALSGIDLVLRPGERVLVTGPSGSGKSTLIALLLGFLAPTAGRIEVNGVDRAEIAGERWRALFGWCEQQAYLFDSSIRENVRLARPDAGDTEIRAAIAAAGAADFLAALPDGLDTLVGEHGAAVSGGERQRLSIARALLADRPVLLADEPAAHLDTGTGDAVTAALLAAGRTVLLVGHRPQDARLVDRVLELDAGRLRERTVAGRPS
jgi:ATP-binding cassette, subfamily C, bacterial CydC